MESKTMAKEMKHLHQLVQVDETANQSGLHFNNGEFNQVAYTKQELTCKHIDIFKSRCHEAFHLKP